MSRLRVSLQVYAPLRVHEVTAQARALVLQALVLLRVKLPCLVFALGVFVFLRLTEDFSHHALVLLPSMIVPPVSRAP